MNKTAKKLIIKGILSESDARWAMNEALEKAIDEVFDVAYQLGFDDGERVEKEDMIVFDPFRKNIFEVTSETEGRPPWQEDEF